MLSVCAASAQTVQSGYFLDNYAYSYRINPSLMNEKPFFAIGLGSINAEFGSDLGISSFIFPNEAGNGLVTALHPSVSSKEFSDKLRKENNFDFNLNYNLLSFGTRRGNKMFNFEINVRNDMNMCVPKGLFEFVKSGSSASAYDLSGFGISDNSVVEVALGAARTRDKFTIGWRAKLLVGAVSASANLSKALLTVNGSEVSADVVADSRMAMKPLPIHFDSSGQPVTDPTFDPGSFGTSGFGGAIDLGVTWKPVHFLTITAGVSDLGIMSWKYGLRSSSAGNVKFTGLNDIDLATTDNITQELDELKEDLLKVADFKFEEGSFSALSATPIKLNAGVRARLPFTRILSIGVLGTYNIGTNYGEVRVGGTLTPLPIISATANVGVSSIGTVCGGALSINLLGINFFTGIDAYMGRVTGIPLSVISGDESMEGTIPAPIDPFHYRVTMGITLQLFGKRIKG